MQLVRRLEKQEENVSGDEASTTPKKIFQLVTQVLMILTCNFLYILCWFLLLLAICLFNFYFAKTFCASFTLSEI